MRGSRAKNDNDARLRRRHATVHSFILRPVPAIEVVVTQQSDDIDDTVDRCSGCRSWLVRWRHGQVPTRSDRAIIATDRVGARDAIEFMSQRRWRSIVARLVGQYVPVGAAERDRTHQWRTSWSRARHARGLFSRPLTNFYDCYVDDNVTGHRCRFIDWLYWR